MGSSREPPDPSSGWALAEALPHHPWGGSWYRGAVMGLLPALGAGRTMTCCWAVWGAGGKEHPWSLLPCRGKSPYPTLRICARGFPEVGVLPKECPVNVFNGYIRMGGCQARRRLAPVLCLLPAAMAPMACQVSQDPLSLLSPSGVFKPCWLTSCSQIWGL